MTKTPQRIRMRKSYNIVKKTTTKNAWPVKVETEKGSDEDASEDKNEKVGQKQEQTMLGK